MAEPMKVAHCIASATSTLSSSVTSHKPEGQSWKSRVVVNTTIVERTSVSQIKAGCQEHRSSSSDWPKNRTEISHTASTAQPSNNVVGHSQ